MILKHEITNGSVTIFPFLYYKSNNVNDTKVSLQFQELGSLKEQLKDAQEVVAEESRQKNLLKRNLDRALRNKSVSDCIYPTFATFINSTVFFCRGWSLTLTICRPRMS